MGVVDVHQSGEAETLTEFNRCYYPKPVDISLYPVMTDMVANDNSNEKRIEQEVMD